MTAIGDRAFQQCGSLESITIPESLRDYDRLAFAFDDTSKLQVKRH